jgi:hypothetical protein
MSLHKFAEQVAANGRGDDSLLVHMTPDEVRNLQKFAEANGTTLTINPDTGLPEAGLLSDLFKAVAPIALGAFLGPAGFGLSSMMAGVATGGITALATGSLSRGLMAGLGAYGGAGLGESLMGAGGNALVAGGAPVGAENLVGGVSSSGATAGSAVSVPPIEQINPSNFNLAKPDVLSAGAKAAAANPMAFAKQNLGNLAYAAAPIAAGLMVPTTTKMPEPRDSGFIRQMAFNINPDTGKPDPLYGMREMTPVKTSEFGNKTFQGQRDLFYQQNPNPYELGVGSLNQPPQQQPARMNTGGIVALADGGDVKHYVIGGTVAADLEKAYAAKDYSKVQDIVSANQVSQADIQNQWKGLDTSGLAGLGVNLYNPEAEALFKQAGSWEGADKIRDDAANAANTAMWNQQNQDKWAADAAKATPNGLAFALANGQTADQYYKTIGNQFNELTGYGDKYANATDAQLDAAAREAQQKYGISYADFMQGIGKTGGSLASQYAIGAGNMGLSGLNTNINDWLTLARNDPKFKAMTGAQQQKAALDAMGTVNMNEADVLRATGKTIAELFPSTLTKPISVIPTGYYGNDTGNPLTKTPGDITTNPDGSVTVHPNIPGRPDGGFTGMGQVRDAYTAGGGSLGYTAPVPKTAAEHNAMYNKLTDDSLDAYNFLMGKGKNLTQRTATADRPVMRRYDEAVLGRKVLRPSVKTTTTKTGTSTGTIGSPQSYFDEKAYLAANPDVAEEIRTGKSVTGQPTQFKSGYDHYVMYGKAGGRPFTGDYEGYTTALALADAAQQSGGGGPGNDGGGGVGGTGGGGSGGNAAGAASAAGGGSSAPGTGNAAAVGDAAAAAAAAASVGVGDSAASGGKRGGHVTGYAMGGGLGSLGSYSDGGRLLRGPGDGVSDSIPATIGRKQQPARLADGEFVIPARIVSELGNGSTDAGAKKLYAMMDRVQRARGKTTGKNKVAANSRSDKYLPA